MYSEDLYYVHQVQKSIGNNFEVFQSSKIGKKYKLWLAALGEWGMLCYTPEEQKVHLLPGIGIPSNALWRQSDVESSKSATNPDKKGPSSEQDDFDAENDFAATKPAKKKVKMKGKEKRKKQTKDITDNEMEESNHLKKQHKRSKDKENVSDLSTINPI
ncbi:hypothetical protein ARMGADRAFT_1030896 [Armillaria gallica]|uniref:Uncharacterized protein n=1 Tax=Armillaria gallica TaxID=47427 RepID=A0A2H3DBP8_ARMGA|nr:hypothetical protein ARMGADRAFT_1030896 [Armillaria gallica]